MNKVRTNYWAKPIPCRKHDWAAWFDDDEPNDDGFMLQGFGRTEQEAIDDLNEAAELHDDERRAG